MNAEATEIQQARGAALSSFAWPDGTCLRHVTTGQPLYEIKPPNRNNPLLFPILEFVEN